MVNPKPGSALNFLSGMERAQSSRAGVGDTTPETTVGWVRVKVWADPIIKESLEAGLGSNAANAASAKPRLATRRPRRNIDRRSVSFPTFREVCVCCSHQ